MPYTPPSFSYIDPFGNPIAAPLPMPDYSAAAVQRAAAAQQQQAQFARQVQIARDPSFLANENEDFYKKAGQNYANAHMSQAGPPGGVMGTGYAGGTSNAAPGLHMVGERGPELVRMNGGEQVVPNNRLGKSPQEFYRLAMLARATGTKVPKQDQQGVTAALSALDNTVDSVSNGGPPSGHYWDAPGWGASDFGGVTPAVYPSLPVSGAPPMPQAPMAPAPTPPTGEQWWYNPQFQSYSTTQGNGWDVPAPYGPSMSGNPAGYPMPQYGQAPPQGNYGMPGNTRFWNADQELSQERQRNTAALNTGYYPGNPNLTLPARYQYAQTYGTDPITGEQTLEGRTQEERRQNSLIGRFGYGGQGVPGGPFAAGNRIRANQNATLPGSPQYDPQAEQDFFDWQDSILANSPHRDALMRGENIGSYMTPELMGYQQTLLKRKALGLPVMRPLPMPQYDYSPNPNGVPTGPSGVRGTVPSGYGI